MARFEKGHTGKPKGATSEIKTLLKELFGDLVEDIMSDYSKLELKQKLILFEKIMPFVVSKPAIEPIAPETPEDKPKQGMMIGGKFVEFQ